MRAWLLKAEFAVILLIQVAAVISAIRFFAT